MNKFEVLEEQNLEDVNGGLVAGAIAGTIVGGAYGLAGAAIAGAANGKTSYQNLWKSYLVGASIGGASGLYSPF
ncbi:class IIb bacteriocin, lactobin A/cerein 7B family [Paraclostridium sordellii]|uniref:class IIb bacteriocin, lactobin A/cerein 7B family n=1 Tax=Paraclostridium sordellii TaxID=1505 RepID=UPI00096A36EE|nr:class IIb bacteriocin, lactobin A/cerein 7B family [Paeniclostridium sordellii]